MSARPKISIGVPVYNGACHLPATLDSLLGQTFGDFELIISDNASTDETPAICREYARLDSRVHYFRAAENLGASANYNTVFQRACADYFKWASANDICMPGFLERCAEVLDRRPDAVLCFPRTRLFSDDIERYEDYHHDVELASDDPVRRYNQLVMQLRLNNVMNGLIRSTTLRRTPLMRSCLSADTLLMAELALHGKFIEVPEYLFYRRMSPEAATVLMGEAAVRAHYQPRRRKPMRFQHWRIAFAHLGLPGRVRLPLKQRLRLARMVGRRIRWSRECLFADLATGLKWSRRGE